jgi:hypothetical protein
MSLCPRSMYYVILRLNGGLPIIQYYTIRLAHHTKDSTKLYISKTEFSLIIFRSGPLSSLVRPSSIRTTSSVAFRVFLDQVQHFQEIGIIEIITGT